MASGLIKRGTQLRQYEMAGMSIKGTRFVRTASEESDTGKEDSMKYGRLFCMVLMMISFFVLHGSVVVRAAEVNIGGIETYNPAKSYRVYRGVYDTNRLYTRPFGSDLWKGSRRPAFLENVTCPEAREKLARYGHWKGRLQRNGSCGPSNEEPAGWAMGNYLNYESAADE